MNNDKKINDEDVEQVKIYILECLDILKIKS
ncbi:hypothetical protein M2102_003355 [Fusobacterium sp. PH5-7]|nr:hypothetical protein [Fusobacterium sp. PH5-7]